VTQYFTYLIVIVVTVVLMIAIAVAPPWEVTTIVQYHFCRFLSVFAGFCTTTYCCCCWLNFNCARKISFSQQSTRYVGTYEYIRHPAPGCMRHVLSIALRTQLTIIVGSHWKVRKCPFAIMQTIHRIPIASKSMLQQIMGWMWIRLSFLRRCLPICVLYVHYLKTNLNMYNVYFHNCERK